MDVPGLYPEHQIEALEDFRPDLIILLVDGSMPLDSEVTLGTTLRSWVENYCEQLADALQHDRKLAETLCSVFVVLNKKDKATADQLRDHEAELRKILSNRLRRGLGARVDDTEYHHCSSVQNSEGSQSIDILIRAVARRLRE